MEDINVWTFHSVGVERISDMIIYFEDCKFAVKTHSQIMINFSKIVSVAFENNIEDIHVSEGSLKNVLPEQIIIFFNILYSLYDEENIDLKEIKSVLLMTNYFDCDSVQDYIFNRIRLVNPKGFSLEDHLQVLYACKTYKRSELGKIWFESMRAKQHLFINEGNILQKYLSDKVISEIFMKYLGLSYIVEKEKNMRKSSLYLSILNITNPLPFGFGTARRELNEEETEFKEEYDLIVKQLNNSYVSFEELEFK